MINEILDEVKAPLDGGFNLAALLLRNFTPKSVETPRKVLQDALKKDLAPELYWLATQLVSSAQQANMSKVAAIALLLINQPRIGKLCEDLRSSKKTPVIVQVTRDLFNSRKANPGESWAAFAFEVTDLFQTAAAQVYDPIKPGDQWQMKIGTRHVVKLVVDVIADDAVSFPLLTIKNMPEQGYGKGENQSQTMHTTLQVPADIEIDYLFPEVAVKVKSHKEFVLTKL
tara:strand:- start:80 stop:763 length:684 start_codon:yes stop_codon:yes gene_type:complete